jgi:hypothetical protein
VSDQQDGQTPGPPPYGQPVPYGPPPAYGQPPPYGQVPYGQVPYGQPPVPFGHPGPQGPYGYPPPHRPTNGLAIASLILGILWIYWVGSVLALIFGYVARNQIRQRGDAGDGLAVAGIVLGWIGVAMIVLLIVLFLAAGTGVLI